MGASRVGLRSVLLIASAMAILARPALAQVPAPKAPKAATPAPRKLSNDDAKRAEEMDNSVGAALNSDRWDQAITRTEDLLALKTRALGQDHFEVTSLGWNLKLLRRIAPMPREDRLAFLSSNRMTGEAMTLHDQGKFAQAQPLFEEALEIKRRLLTDEHPDTASAYNNVAYNLESLGKFAQAQPKYQKSLEILRRLLTDDHPDTAQLYSNVGASLDAQGKYAEGQSLKEKSLEIRRRILTDDHLDTAQGYNNLAFSLDKQGKYAQATPLFEKALEIRRRLLTEDHPLTAATYNNLADNLSFQGKYAQALPLHEKALKIRRGLFSDDHPDTAQSYNNLANVLTELGMYAQAQPLYEKSLEMQRRLLTDDHPLTATAYGSVAYNLYRQGKYAEAHPLFVRALEIRRSLLSDDHPDTATSYNNLANCLSEQGKSVQAQPMFEKALEITRRLLTDDHPDTATTYSNLATCLKMQGKYAEARPLFEKALDIKRRWLTDDHPRTASAFNNLATILEAQGEHARAQPLYQKALEIDLRTLTEDHPETARHFSNVASNFHARGRYVEARDHWIHAVNGLDAARVRAAFSGMDRTGPVVPARVALAAVLARLGQPADAWQRLEEDLGRGLLDELAARQDRRLAPEDRERLRDLTVKLEQLDRLVEATPKDLGDTERAGRFAELARERERASIAMGEFQAALFRDYGPLAGRVAHLKEIQAALPPDAALITWVDLTVAGPKTADPDGDHWGVVVRPQGVPSWIALSGTGPEGAWTDEDTSIFGRLRSRLRRPDTDSEALRPLIERLRSQRLAPLAAALGATADGLPAARRLIVLPSHVMAGIPVEALLPPDDPRIVSYAPSATVLKYLREQPRPDRNVGLLALGDPDYDRPDKSSDPGPPPDHGLLVRMVVPGGNAATHGLKEGDVLLAYGGKLLNRREDLAVVSVGDTPVAVEIWRGGVVSRRDLAPGKLNVVVDTRPAPEAVASDREYSKLLVATRGGDDFAALPGTRLEVEALERLFEADGRPARVLLGAVASEPEMDALAASGELGRFGFLHLATHGVIDEALPLRSAVILSQSDLPDPLRQVLDHKPAFDGRLSVREIQRGWDIHAELVTLSACETALGPQAGGEGFVGFTQALLMAGARSVCLSLWKVDDLATSLLMQRFYANLLGRRPGLSAPMGKADALREAKFWLRKLDRKEAAELTAKLSGGLDRGKGAEGRKPAEASGDAAPFADPHYWAAFVLVGDPD